MDREELIRLLKTCKERFCEEEEEWKKCFKRNIFIHHPDKGGEEENFKELNNCNAMVKDLEEMMEREMAARAAAERARARAAEIFETDDRDETDTQTGSVDSEFYSDDDSDDGLFYVQESTATSPPMSIRGRASIPKQNRHSVSPRNMTGTMQFRADRSASRRRNEEAAENAQREMRRREVIRLNRAAARAAEREMAAARRRALDERERRAEVSQDCCWTLTFK